MPTKQKGYTSTMFTCASSMQGWCIKESQQEKELQTDLCAEEFSLLTHHNHHKITSVLFPTKTL